MDVAAGIGTGVVLDGNGCSRYWYWMDAWMDGWMDGNGGSSSNGCSSNSSKYNVRFVNFCQFSLPTMAPLQLSSIPEMDG